MGGFCGLTLPTLIWAAKVSCLLTHLLGGHCPPQPPGPSKVWGSPHCAHSSSWTGLSISPCVPWGGARLPPIAVVPKNGPGPPSRSQALRKRSLSYCVCVCVCVCVCFLFLIVLKLLPNFGLRLPRSGSSRARRQISCCFEPCLPSYSSLVQSCVLSAYNLLGEAGPVFVALFLRLDLLYAWNQHNIVNQLYANKIPKRKMYLASNGYH